MAESLVDRVAGLSVAVVSPALLVSVTIERAPAGGDEIHVHPAGQGYWVARMVRSLGARPILVTTCGGEAAEVAGGLATPDVDLRLVRVGGPGGVYVDDRRSGERERLADAAPAPLDRHAVDDLVSGAVAEGLTTGIVVLTGSNGHGSVKPEFFSALAGGLAAVGVPVVADLSGDELAAALDAGVDAVKVADDELGTLPAGGSSDDDPIGRAASIRKAGGADVFVTMAGEGVVADTAAGRFTGAGPRLRSVEPRGAGDSFTAALAVGRRAGFDVADQLRLAIAAAATNVLRHGLGSATREAVRSMLDRVTVEHESPPP